MSNILENIVGIIGAILATIVVVAVFLIGITVFKILVLIFAGLFILGLVGALGYGIYLFILEALT